MRKLFIVLGIFFISKISYAQKSYTIDLSVPSPCLSKLDNNEIYGFEVYPNPVTHVLLVQGKDLEGVFELKDMEGKLIQSREFKNENFEINVADLTPGVYFAVINSDKKRYQSKVVIQ